MEDVEEGKPGEEGTGDGPVGSDEQEKADEGEK